MILQAEIEEMLKNKVIAPVQNEPEQIIKSIFIALKKSSGFRPVINLNSTLVFTCFERAPPKEEDFLCEMDLKNLIFHCFFTKTLKSI